MLYLRGKVFFPRRNNKTIALIKGRDRKQDLVWPIPFVLCVYISRALLCWLDIAELSPASILTGSCVHVD